MSGVVGTDAVRGKLGGLADALTERLREAHEQGAKELQAVCVPLVPRFTGKVADLLASEDAVGPPPQAKKQRAGGAEPAAADADTFVAFGFRTPEMQREGYYALFVEFGTAGHEAGEQRRAGKDKRGKQRFAKVKRKVPARPARPFMRPAVIMMRARLRELRDVAWGKATVDTLKDGVTSLIAEAPET